MGVISASCTECKANDVSMRITGHSSPQMTGNQVGRYPFGYVMVVCSRCEKPSLFVVDYKGTATWQGVANSLQQAMVAPLTNNLSATEHQISRFKVNVAGSPFPDHLPDDVLKAFQQAETNFDLENHEEAAATMYRRALERALKFSHPALTGTLAAKIKTLVSNGELPRSLGDWADEIRLIGNDGAHDDGVTREELKAARMFCDSFLRYLITLPTEVASRRAQPR
ncbi:DUF4145 domain-containing protein [Rhizobium sp. No.120]